MQIRDTLALFGAFSLLLASAACRDKDPVSPRAIQKPARSLGLIEITITGIGTPQMSASASAPRLSSSSGANLALTPPANGDASGTGAIQLQALSTGSFTVGVRGSGGVRYVYASYRVRNAQLNGVAYNTPRNNLTFLGVSTSGTLGESAIKSMFRFDGSIADPAIAPQVMPTGLVSSAPFTSGYASASADVLQILTEGEAGAVTANPGVNVLPYGFVTRNATNGGRSLPASPGPSQYDGVVTFAYRFPLQATAADDPFTVTGLFLAEDDSETRVTQSLEEQTSAGAAAFLARATQIGATMKTVLPGGVSHWGDPSHDTRTLCSVRTAGASAVPTAYMVNRNVSGVSIGITNPYPSFPLWSGGPVMRDLSLTALDGASPLTDVPVQMNFGTAGVLTRVGSGSVRMLPRLNRATTTVSATACGITSNTFTLGASGYNPLASGVSIDASLGINANGTVSGWGFNNFDMLSIPGGLADVAQVDVGEWWSFALKTDGTVAAWTQNYPLQPFTNVVQIAATMNTALMLMSDGTVTGWGEAELIDPARGLTDVVQIAGGESHAVALKSDGTVVAWGSPTFDNGQTNVPPGLSNVVQVEAGTYSSFAVKSDGTVVGWGSIPSPTTLTNVVQVSAGYDFMVALKADGTIEGWGSGPLSGGTNNVQVSVGYAHWIALKTNGTLIGGGSVAVPGNVLAVP